MSSMPERMPNRQPEPSRFAARGPQPFNPNVYFTNPNLIARLAPKERPLGALVLTMIIAQCRYGGTTDTPQSALARFCGVKRDRIRAVEHSLEAAGLITITRRANRRVIVWVPPKDHEDFPLAEPDPCGETVDNSSRGGPQEGHSTDPVALSGPPSDPAEDHSVAPKRASIKDKKRTKTTDPEAVVENGFDFMDRNHLKGRVIAERIAHLEDTFGKKRTHDWLQAQERISKKKSSSEGWLRTVILEGEPEASKSSEKAETPYRKESPRCPHCNGLKLIGGGSQCGRCDVQVATPEERMAIRERLYSPPARSSGSGGAPVASDQAELF